MPWLSAAVFIAPFLPRFTSAKRSNWCDFDLFVCHVVVYF